MIERIRGTLVEVQLGRVVVDCAGVGYALQVPSVLYGSLPAVGGEVIFFTRQIFREDGQLLVGFFRQEERSLFDLLTGVKGCGPKLSLQVISDLGIQETVAAIQLEDPRRLAKATGVGQKLAERIILELKSKVIEFHVPSEFGAKPSHDNGQPLSEVVSALVNLGFKRSESEVAADQTDESLPIEDRLKQALRLLMK